jgi:5'-3' exonuclease
LDIYLIDGTYELFRHFYALPSHRNSSGEEVAATRGVLGSIVSMLESGVTHLGVATDHVIESFRNDLWPGYKTSEGVEQRLLAQFPLLEDALVAMGIMVWPMVELEADDAMAGAASRLVEFPEVERIYLCSPDKDLAQCVKKTKVVMLDRRRKIVIDEKGVLEKFGVSPSSIPDYLALVGDTADGYPGLSGWGEKSAGEVLSCYGHLEDIPKDLNEWKVKPRGADKLATTLRENSKLAFLFRDLATLRTGEPKTVLPEDLRWKGARDSFAENGKRLDLALLNERIQRLSEAPA